MRKPIIVGNWKMNKTPSEALEFMKGIEEILTGNEAADYGIGAPFVDLDVCCKNAKNLIIAAENCNELDSGAYTGEVSVPMLKEVGITYCIIGHSERRDIFGETNEMINKIKSIAQFADCADETAVLAKINELTAKASEVETLRAEIASMKQAEQEKAEKEKTEKEKSKENKKKLHAVFEKNGELMEDNIKEFVYGLNGTKLEGIYLAADMLEFCFDNAMNLHAQGFCRVIRDSDVLITTHDYQSWDGEKDTNNDDSIIIRKKRLYTGLLKDINNKTFVQ